MLATGFSGLMSGQCPLGCWTTRRLWQSKEVGVKAGACLAQLFKSHVIVTDGAPATLRSSVSSSTQEGSSSFLLGF